MARSHDAYEHLERFSNVSSSKSFKYTRDVRSLPKQQCVKRLQKIPKLALRQDNADTIVERILLLLRCMSCERFDTKLKSSFDNVDESGRRNMEGYTGPKS